MLNLISQNGSHTSASRACGLLGEPEKVAAAVTLAKELLIAEKRAWLTENHLALDMLSDAKCE